MKPPPDRFRRFADLVNTALPKPKCRCWGCIRAVGLTPPYQARHAYKTADHPPITMDFRVDSEATGDPWGIPQPSRRTKADKEEARQATAEERRHLREAVRNREAQ